MQKLMAIPAPQGGLRIAPCDARLPASFALSEGLLVQLVEWALRLEELHGSPRDIEWCLDHHDHLFIMQSRALKVESPTGEAVEYAEHRIENPVVLSGGTRACGGMAAGIVYNTETETGLQEVPEGAILVTKDAAPGYATVMSKVAAVVADQGGAAGHLAAIAREFGIPALFDTGSATGVLASGRLVTVCADTRTIYDGRVEAPGSASEPSQRTFRCGESPFSNKLQKALRYIAPLNLVDPEADNFAPRGCETFHDILRFCHEKAVMGMFSLGGGGSRRARGVRKLKSDIPIVVYLLDLGDGLEKGHADKSEIHVDAIRCVPFKLLWKGLSHPGISWNPEVAHFDWKEFDRLSHGFVKKDSIQLGSYAILSGDYLNFHIHFGYHFVVLDTLCTDEAENNYLMLRFAGGGAQASSRYLRVRFLEDVLQQFGFKVETRGDLIDAQASRCGREKMEEMLEMIGALLGCTRLLDMALKDEHQVRDMAQRFLRGERDLSPLRREQPDIET